MAARDEILPALKNGEVDFDPQDTHRQIARKVIDAGLTDASFVTVRRAIGRWRRGELEDYEPPADDSSSSEQTERPNYDTWDEWAEAEDHTGSSEGVDYHKRDYYYNDEDDTYVFWVDHSNSALVINGDDIRSIKKDYSDWVGDVATINDICRAHGISRRDFVAVKRALGMTHSDSPFTDEQLADPSSSIEDQLGDLAKENERQLEKSWQKKQWSKTKKDARKWREFKRGTVQPLYENLQRTPIDTSTYKYADGQLDDFYFFPHTTDTHLEQLNEDGTGLAENKRRFLDCLHKNVHRCGHFGRPQKTIIQLGGDQFNSDHPAGQTTGGTPQQQSVSGPEAFFKVADVGIEAIEICRKLSPVEVRVVPGNHDWRSAVAYYWGLQHKYNDIDGVEVVGGAEKWQFDTYGKNLVTWTHGDKVGGGETKKNWNLSSILLHECPQMVGQSTHFYCFLGHLHHLLEKEDGVHTLQGGSTAKQDRWHKVGKHGSNHACQTAYLLAEDGGQKVRFTAEP